MRIIIPPTPKPITHNKFFGNPSTGNPANPEKGENPEKLFERLSFTLGGFSGNVLPDFHMRKFPNQPDIDCEALSDNPQSPIPPIDRSIDQSVDRCTQTQLFLLNPRFLNPPTNMTACSIDHSVNSQEHGLLRTHFRSRTSPWVHFPHSFEEHLQTSTQSAKGEGECEWRHGVLHAKSNVL